MNILAIDTSCDETAVAITRDKQIVSSLVWSQASLHSSFGGVYPSLAQREHKLRIDWVTQKAIKQAGIEPEEINAIAVTVGLGLAVALEVGINKAKELASKYKLPLIPVSHAESHLLSSLAFPSGKMEGKTVSFPALGLVLSGGTTQLVLIKNIGEYELLAQTQDDALGEALDKAARLLGFGYPGGAILEKEARHGNPKAYKLPIPLANDRDKNRFSYSGLKTAFVRLFESINEPSRQDISDLAASFQEAAFEHINKVLEYQILKHKHLGIKNLLFGGGVANNIEIRKKLRKTLNKHSIKLNIPYSKKLLGDNAGMIGVCAYLKNKDKDLSVYLDYQNVDRQPRLGIV